MYNIPEIKKKLLIEQKYLCPICTRDLRKLKPRDICIDHNHKNGLIRSVLCRGCNSLEGKVYRNFVRVGHKNQGVDYVTFLTGLIIYTQHEETNMIHPKFKEKKK